MRDNRSGVYLQLTGPSAKAHFKLIEQRHHDAVDLALSPLGTVEWRLLPDAKESQITLVRPTTPTKKETWLDLNDWMARALETMHGLFSPIVKGLDASEYERSEGTAGAGMEESVLVQDSPEDVVSSL